MPKNKLKKINEYIELPNTFQAVNKLKGRWQEVFGNKNPIVIELACGRGEYTIGLAQLYPNKNFVGIDVKAARMWEGAKFAIENNLHNVAFLRIQIDFLLQYFEPSEVNEIWITFPDPQPQKSREKQRLTNPKFLNIYKELLGVNTNQTVNLKTDSDSLFQYTLQNMQDGAMQIMEVIMDVEKESPNKELNISTYYERKWRSEGISIKYLKFQFI